jgi:hypothetical protein
MACLFGRNHRVYPRCARKNTPRGEILAVFRQRKIQGGVQKNARICGKEVREKLIVHACFRLLRTSKKNAPGRLNFLL